MSRKQTVRARPGKKAELERKRDERATRRALAKDRRNRAGEAEDTEEFASFTSQLQAFGLRLREVPGDGNCLFRALGDQLEGHSRNHLKHRQETVDYMIKHRNDFEPFVEDDVPFHRHVDNLAQAGTFAGNDAIVAFARNNQVNVVIHQLNNPLWQIRGLDKGSVRELHIAYRYGEHYDSVRRVNDNTEAPANLQTEKLSKNESNRPSKRKASDERRGDAVQKVRNATGCADVHLILRSLEAESYNIESTIQVILQIEELRQIDGGVSVKSDPPRNSGSQDTRGHDRLQSQRRSGHAQPREQQQCWQSEVTARRPEEGAAEKRDKQDENDQCGQKVSNKQQKVQQRMQKKQRQEERHRQRLQEQRSDNTDNNRQDQETANVTVVKAFAALSI